MKIYTKAGDHGETGLLDGRRVLKDDDRIEAYGTVDELSVSIGLARTEGVSPSVDALLLDIQSNLFVVGAELAAPGETNLSSGHIETEHVQQLEQAIDEYQEHLEPLQHFILPGGTLAAGFLHQARTICRRAERRVVTLGRCEDVSPFLVPYLNRLSDLLFVLARVANSHTTSAEIVWSAAKVQ